MKPLVSALNAWSCIVVSVFAIVILSAIGGMYKAGSHTVMGSTEDPDDGRAVASAIWGAVVVYAIFVAFCGLQALLHFHASRKGAITLS